jgi:hypothetical protein
MTVNADRQCRPSTSTVNDGAKKFYTTDPWSFIIWNWVLPPTLRNGALTPMTDPSEMLENRSMINLSPAISANQSS